jgi:hypothetical protein|tara:strand:- start:19 stop:1464 length:1446 start_codon:yes stop_codon:yes gene_type:complete
VSNDFIRSAGDFHIAEAKIISSSGVEVDINKNNNIAHIKLFENIQQNSITGEILLHDSAGYVSELPIIGQEYLKLKIQTPSINHEVNIIDFTKNVFVINSVQTRGEVGNSISVYLLSFSSSEIVKNQRTKVADSLDGTYSKIVVDMLDRVNCRKKLFVEPTKGVKRIVAPNIRPFDVISMALNSASSSINENFSPSYLFFENFDGYHFRSLASLYAQPVVQKYTTHQAGGQIQQSGPAKGIANLEAELANIIDYEIVENSNTLFNHTTGVLASTLLVHNIYNKSFKQYTYNYFDSFNGEKHITSYHGKKQFPIFSDATVEEGLRNSDFPARTFLESVSEGETDVNNTTKDGTEPYAAPDPQNTLQERISTVNQLDRGLILNISTHGNTIIKAGDIVEVDIPIVASVKVDGGRENDRFYNGVFIVKRIVHEFDFGEKKHGTILTLVKDSLSEKLDGPKDQIEPKPKKSARVISDKETFYPQL